MRLQKSTLFGLLAVLELAREPGRQMSATDVAAIHGISVNHLAKVMRELGRAGLLESVRGVGGGYRFAGNARRVTLMDVIGLFEDIGAGESGGAQTPETDIGGALSAVLAEIDDIARATFESITLNTLLNSMNWRSGRRNGA